MGVKFLAAAAAIVSFVTQLCIISFKRLYLQCLTKWYFLFRDTNAHKHTSLGQRFRKQTKLHLPTLIYCTYI